MPVPPGRSLRPRGVGPTPLRELAQVAGGVVRGPAGTADADGPGGVLVRGVTLDSAAVQPGDLFAAVPG
ncbi:MAG TPA: hypothetical protein VGR21_13635, partial [Cryptosporangiaceae bacterium]|nr:hypothetical protein [Cryptosporangiaceae bacterium]